MKKNTKLNFNGQNIYVGIDVHKKSWSVAIILNQLLIKKFSMNPSPKQLIEYLRKNYPNGEYYSVYEAGFSGFWAHRELLRLGINNIVVNPADVPTRGKERRSKTDRVDAVKLARELSVGHLTGIYVPEESIEALRVLVRLRRQLVKEQVRTKQRIKSLLMYLGKTVTDEGINDKTWSKGYIRALRYLAIEQQNAKKALDTLLDNLEYIRKQIAYIVNQLKEHISKDERARDVTALLRSVPGVGFIFSVILYTEIIDIERFGRLDELASYIGLTPAVRSSGERQITLGLVNQNNKYIRNALIEAAWVAVRKDRALQMAYGKLLKKMPKNKAIIRISKKLLNRIRSVWKYGHVYVLSVVE